MNEELEQLEEARQMQVRMDRVNDLAKDSRNLESGDGGVPTYWMERDRPRPRRNPGEVPLHIVETRNQALRAVDQMSDELTARAADRLEQLVEADVAEQGISARYLAAVGDPDYRSAFGQILAEPQSAHLRWTPAQHEAVQRVNRVMMEQRALGLGSQGGAYPVPVVLDPTANLISDGALNPIRQIARVENVAGPVWKGVNTLGITAACSAEAAETTDNSPTLPQPSLDVEKAQAFVPFSIEVGEDWGSLQTELARLLADSKDVLEATKYVSGLGHGSSEPEGLLVGGTSVVTSASTATFAIGDCYSLVEALPARWGPRAVALAHPTIWDAAYRFVGGGSTEPPVLSGREGPFLGRPKYEATTMTSGTLTGSSVVTYGDFSQYLIADRVGMNVELVPHLFGTTSNYPTGQRGLYCYWRNSAVVLTASAFKTLKMR